MLDDTADSGADHPQALEEELGPGVTRRWRLDEVHYAGRTPYQELLIAGTAHGVTLFCDGERQSAADTQRLYHEALFVPAVLLAARCERVLVIGSSEGVISQLAVAAGAAVVDHVDIDAACVRACAEHLPYGYTPDELAAAERHRGPVRLHYVDGATFIGGTTARYDVVVVDLPDERPDEPDAQLNRLYTAEFLRGCAALLDRGGVVVSQAGSPALWRNTTLRASWQRFHEVFAQVVPYVSDEQEWAFLSGRTEPVADPVERIAAGLPRLGFTAESLDAAALRSRCVAPYHVRR